MLGPVTEVFKSFWVWNGGLSVWNVELRSGHGAGPASADSGVFPAGAAGGDESMWFEQEFPSEFRKLEANLLTGVGGVGDPE
jgi:hypothetical protein